MRTPVAPVAITRVEAGSASVVDDILVTEEPLEIRLGHGPLDDRLEFRLSVTMRTPGNDEELALGFLFTEGIITSVAEVVRVVPCENVKEEERGNVLRAELRPEVDVDPVKWQRNFYTTSSCGVCGKSSIDAVHTQCTRPLGRLPKLDHALIASLPDRMRAEQTVFKHTGGIHAAALFNEQGELLLLREDVGRHNAVDKVIGALLAQPESKQQATETPALREASAGDQPTRLRGDTTAGKATNNLILLVSGRAGFELVQKCIMAGIPAMIAIGAPSSLAVQLAKESGLTLIGFLRGDRFNVYSGSL